MPGMIDMKEYLVPLGFDIKSEGLKNFFSMVDAGRKKISEFSFIANNKILSTVTTYVGLASQAAEASLGFASNVAKFDKNMELSARRMWMTKDAYMAVSQAVEQLGYSMDDIGTIALDPELSSQFRQLYSMTQGFQGDYNRFSDSLRTFREFEFKFKQLSLLGNYFFKLLGGSLAKYFEGPLGEANSSLSDIIAKFQKDLPKYVDIATRKLGPFVSMMIRRGKNILDTSIKIYEYFSKNPESLNRALKVLFTIYTILNPLKGLALFIFSKISEYVDDINSGTVDMEEKWGGVERLVKSIANFVETVYDFIGKIISKLDEWGFLDKASSLIDWASNLLGGRFGKLTGEKKLDEMSGSEKAGHYIGSGVGIWSDMFGAVSDAFSEFSNKLNGKNTLVSKDKVSPEFIKLIKSMGFENMADFAKTDYYRQIMEQVSNVDNSNKTIQVTNNYNNVSGSDAKRLSEEQIEQLNAALVNMSY